jgi:drug/metabolite transporter (DMT)-like permease
MSPELLIAVIAGLGGMLGWGLADFFAKKTIDEVGDVVSLVWAHIFGTGVLCLIVAYQFFVADSGLGIPSTLSEWSLLALFGALQAAVYLFVYKGFAKGQVAVLSPIFASFSGLVAIASVLFFGEVLSGYVVPVLVLIFIGVILLSLDVRSLAKSGVALAAPGVREVLIATVIATIWTLYWDVFVGGKDWIAYAFVMYAAMTVAMYLYAIQQKINLRVSHKPTMWKFLFLIGACEIVAYLAISYGYSATSLTSIVAILSGAFSLPVIILARIFLNERPTGMQTLGSIAVILGVVLLPLL